MSDEEIKLRLKICYSCDNKILHIFMTDAYRCKICGCDIEAISQKEYKKCPLGKW